MWKDLSDRTEELKEATTRRSNNALTSWYDRLKDLYAYKKETGNCMVPQKYPANHALGIVSKIVRILSRLRTVLLTLFETPCLVLAVGEQAAYGETDA